MHRPWLVQASTHDRLTTHDSRPTTLLTTHDSRLSPMDILLMGPPGAGKGTQGALLAERLGLPKFATGDLLRDAVKRATPVGLKAKAVMEAGHLVNDEIIMGVVRDELAKPEAGKGVIFDGVVRTVPQAEGVTALLSEKGRKINFALFF